MAKYKPDFTITVLSESLYQYNNPVQTPLTLGPFGPINLRRKCVPYLAGSLTALDRGMRSACFGGDIHTVPLIAGGARTFEATIKFDHIVNSELIAPGGSLYDPFFSLSIPQALQAPGGRLYDPLFSFSIPQALQTPGGQLYDPFFSLTTPLPLQAPGGQLYNPTFVYDTSIDPELVAPGGGLYDPSFSLGIVLPLQTPGGQLYNPSWSFSVILPLQAPNAQTYNPSLFSCPVQYTVGTGGNYATIQAAVDKVEASDQPLVCSYEILISGSTSYAENVIITNITTSVSNTLTLKQWDADLANPPIIDGGVTGGQSEMCLWIKDVDNVIVDGIKFTGWGWTSAGGPNLTSEPPGAAAVYLGRYNIDDGITNVTLQNCTMSAEQGGEYGVYAASGSTGNNTNLTVYNCVLTGTDTYVNSGAYGLSFNSTYNSTVSASIIQGWNTQGVNIDGDGISGGGITLRQSEISKCYGVGLYIDNQRQCVIKNNLIYSCATASNANTIYLIGELGGTTMYYNTIIGTSSTEDLIRFDSVTNSISSYFKNNIYRFSTFDPGSTKAIYSFGDAPTAKFNSDYNLFSVIEYSGSDIQYDNVASCDVCDGGGQAYYPLLSEWQSAYSEDANSEEDHGPNPAGIFADGANLDFYLTAGSVAIGAATDVSITVDKDGTARPFEGTFDQGCYEYTGSDPYQGLSYTQIVSASNPNNTTPMHVGSLYLAAQTYTTIGALFTDIEGGVGGSDVHVEFRRFTGGASLLTLTNDSTAGPTWIYVTSSNVVVSDADWYDIYISASSNPATSSIKGIYYEY